MINLNVNDETSKLKAVILGIATQNGPTPLLEDAYDPKSAEHIKNGTYPIEGDMVYEMNEFEKILKKYKVEVYRPNIIKDVNQIFTRDIGFVIGDTFVNANILPERYQEIKAIEYIIKDIPKNKVLQPSEDTHIEGGDVILHNDHVFVGTYRGKDYKEQITARTNEKGVKFLKEHFKNRKIVSFDLIKSKTDARYNALHLDCCFQPVGKNKAIVFKDGFRKHEEYLYIENYFGEDNLFFITRDEMYNMYSNVFSVDTGVVIIEENFTRLKKWLSDNYFKVESVPYSEIAKQEGLLRCSTLPLFREE